jgi:hypothetical protein
MAYVGSFQGDGRALPELAEDDDGEDVPEPEDAGEEPEPEAAADDEAAADPFGYKAKHFAYVSSSAGAEFMGGGCTSCIQLTHSLKPFYLSNRSPFQTQLVPLHMVGKELRRAAASEEDGAAPAEKQGVTFDIVDQGVPLVDVPNVLMKAGLYSCRIQWTHHRA